MMGAADSIADHTSPADPVLIWGSEASLNFMAGRRAPTRYVYQLPLYTKGYQNPEMVETFLRDLQATPPAMIVDVSSTDTRIPPLDATARSEWVPTFIGMVGLDSPYGPLPEMEQVYAFLSQNYHEVGEISAPGGAKWAVYQRAGTAASSTSPLGAYSS